MVTTILKYVLPNTKVVCFYNVMQSHGHMSLKVALLVITHHMTVKSCDPESIQHEATTKTIIMSSISSMTTTSSSGSMMTMSSSSGITITSGSSGVTTISSSSNRIMTSSGSGMMMTTAAGGRALAYFSFILYSVL